MSNVKKISGTDYVLFIDPAGAQNYKLVVCLTDQNYNRATNKIDAKSKCGPDSLAGAQEIDLDFKGQIVFSPEIGQISEFELNQLWQNKTTIGWKLSRVEPQLGDSVYFGTAFISKLNAAYGLDSVATFDGALGVFGLPTSVQIVRPAAPGLSLATISESYESVEMTAILNPAYEMNQHQYSYDGGLTWGIMTTNPFLIPNTGYADGKIRLRVAASVFNLAGLETSWGQLLAVWQPPVITEENDIANTITFTPILPPADMEYSIDGGTTWLSPAVSPIAIPGALAIGNFKVRAKFNLAALRDAGAMASNTTAFTV